MAYKMPDELAPRLEIVVGSSEYAMPPSPFEGIPVAEMDPPEGDIDE